MIRRLDEDKVPQKPLTTIHRHYQIQSVGLLKIYKTFTPEDGDTPKNLAINYNLICNFSSLWSADWQAPKYPKTSNRHAYITIKNILTGSSREKTSHSSVDLNEGNQSPSTTKAYNLLHYQMQSVTLGWPYHHHTGLISYRQNGGDNWLTANYSIGLIAIKL